LKLRNHSRFLSLSATAFAFWLVWVAAPINAKPAGRIFTARKLVGTLYPFQGGVPQAPADRTLTYWRVGEDTALQALPVEAGATTLRPEVPAGSDKWGHVELKGETAQTIIANREPHFFIFVPDTIGVHPPLLVRLSARRGVRRVAAMAQRGQRGFAVAAEEIVKPRYRVLGRDAGMIYMEVWGREPLLPGEYAFIGSELARIATFRIGESKN
jgi:hypothetical protein